MKVCSKCKNEKDEADFWKRNNRKSGVNSECKGCCSERRKQQRIVDGEQIREKRKRYYNENREKLCGMQVESQKGNKRYRQYQNSYALKKRKEGDIRYLARQILFLAIKGKILVRPEVCENCKSIGKVEGHHEDYKLPLSVNWLCRKCHLEKHNGRF